LRSHVGNRYVTAINPHSGLVQPSLELDVRYDATGGRDPALQRFRSSSDSRVAPGQSGSPTEWIVTSPLLP
jgi:hypothetical protein